MKVEIRKSFMHYTKGQVVETSEERGKAWISSRLAVPYIEPKSAAKLLEKVLAPDEVQVPEKNKEGAQALKKQIEEYYATKINA